MSSPVAGAVMTGTGDLMVAAVLMVAAGLAAMGIFAVAGGTLAAAVSEADPLAEATSGDAAAILAVGGVTSEAAAPAAVPRVDSGAEAAGNSGGCAAATISARSRRRPRQP
jgi:hypothetical protein